jgi:hypothetical protein
MEFQPGTVIKQNGNNWSVWKLLDFLDFFFNQNFNVKHYDQPKK